MHDKTLLVPGSTQIIGAIAFLALLTLAFGCASVPPEVARTHQKQFEIIESLERSHLAMVDSYIDQKMQNFEQFFFNKYGPVFLENWKKSFQDLNERPYDENKDFPTLYNDLVAVYQAESAPIEAVRIQLRGAIEAEYRNVLSAHKAVGGWLDSLEKLNAAQRQAINGLFDAIKPGLTLEVVDKTIDTVMKNVEARIDEISK